MLKASVGELSDVLITKVGREGGRVDFNRPYVSRQ